MIDQYIPQLRSSDPQTRKNAVTALAQSGDPTAIGVLLKIAEKDPDPGVRDLAAQGGRHLQRSQWRKAASEGLDVALPGEIPEEQAAETRARARRRIQMARQHLDLAERKLTARDKEGALFELTHGLLTDPTLKSDDRARRLASTLMGIPSPEEAINTLLETVRKNQKERERRPWIDINNVRFVALSAVTALMLWLSIMLFIRLLEFNLIPILEQTQLIHRVQHFIRALAPASLFRAVGPATMLLACIFIGNMGMFLLSASMGGTSGLFHFHGTVMAAQVFTLMLANTAFSFLPIAAVMTVTNDAGQAIKVVGVSAMMVMLGVLWNLIWQGYFVARLQGINLWIGAGLAFFGLFIFIFFGNLLGVLKGIRIA
jgi:hypothetical protein